jgi:hypothetical protein
MAKLSVSVLGTVFVLVSFQGLSAHAQDAAAEVGVQVAPNLGQSAQVAQGREISTKARRLSGTVQRLLDAARKDGDIIRVTCLNDKLTQVNANLRSAETRMTALEGAINRDRANHEFTVLSVIGQKLDTLSQEASQCVGQDVFEPGSAQVVTTIAEGTTTVNAVSPPSLPSLPTAVVVPPPISSSS